MRYFIALALLFISFSLSAQDNVGIGTLTPNPNAALDIESNDKGLLIPRLDAAQRAAIVGLTNIESGLLVFDQTDNLFYYWDGNVWLPMPIDLDEQDIDSVVLTGSVLEVFISNGNSATVDLGPLAAQGPAGPAGPAGADGADGVDGAQGPAGPAGPAGADGADGVDGAQGPAGPAGADGVDGAQGPAGADGVDGAQGPAGPQGPAGVDGQDGTDGASAYQVALNNGFVGTETDWLNSLVGADGVDGAQGPQGPAGPAGADGADGVDGAQGPAGPAGPAGPGGTDDQNIQGSGLAGTILTIGIEGGTSETIDLSSLTSSDDWALLGNSGTDENTNYLGTNDNQDLVFRTNGQENMRINTNGNVGIGTANNTARLYTNVPDTDSNTLFGFYNDFNGVNPSSSTYGIYNRNLSTTPNSPKFGIYNLTNEEGTGPRYGIYNLTSMNSASNSNGFGTYSYLLSYGIGDHRASFSSLNHSGTAVTTKNYASYNLLTISTSSNTSTNFGEYTEVDFSAGTRYGEYKEMRTSTAATGTIYGDFNLINGNGNDVIYGVYTDITNTGSGSHYGLYSDVPGGSNDYAALFNSGNVVMNEIGGIYDVRIESDTREYALFVDAEDDLVRFGTNFGFAQGQTNDNGDSVNNILVDYVVDMDIGASTGTAIGIGSIEYLLDASSLTTINNNFAPSTDNVRDLGSSALRWDDVYATNGVIQTSDRTEKESIQSLSYGLNDLLKLNPVSFKWNKTHIGITPISTAEKEVKLGFIAQEVMEVLPEIVQTHNWIPVSEDRPGEFALEPMPLLGMSYHEFTPVIVKAIQEQQEIIESLKTELKEVKALLEQNGIK